MTRAYFKRLKKKIMARLSGLSDLEKITMKEIFDNYYYGFPNHGIATEKERRVRTFNDFHKMSKILKGVNISKEMGWE